MKINLANSAMTFLRSCVESLNIIAFPEIPEEILESTEPICYKNLRIIGLKNSPEWLLTKI